MEFDKQTGAPVRKFPVTLTNGQRSRSASTEGEYVQAVYDGFTEPETKAEAKQAEKQLSQPK